jgi:tryptophan halogenase
MSSINNIVILGAGSAGWMSAATLIKNFPDKNITVIESPNVPTVGVGESTIGQINEWLHSLDIKDDDWMKFCDASYKLSIKFTDFYKKDSGGFHYPFGAPTFDQVHFPQGVNDWFIKKAMEKDLPLSNFAETYFPAVTLSENNKIIENKNNELPGWSFDRDVAYHFDATKFGIWLKENYAMPKGVKVIRDDVVDIVSNDDGVEYLTLTDGSKVYADLFIDCTGFKALLIEKTLNTKFESYEDLLPNNSAWATRIAYTDKERELEPYTNCTAIDNGWVWNIPLWSRIGTGYVYSDKFISDEDALVQFKDYLINHRKDKKSKELVDTLEFRNIKMRVGIHEKIYNKNVCAIGLSAGFIEPLESSGLYTVHEFLLKLVSALQRQEMTEFDKLAFNEACRGDFRAFSEFVALHYALSHRDDTAYWKACRNRNFPKTMSLGIYSTFGIDNLIYRKYVSNVYDNDMGGMLCISAGMNFLPYDESTVKRITFRFGQMDYVNHLKEKCFPFWDHLLKTRKQITDSAPTVYKFLKEKYLR